MRKLACLVMALVLGMQLTGCASTRLPLCPKLAALSYPENSKPDVVVNRFLLERAQERHIKISVLSQFVAVLSGSIWDLSWFQKNYAFMLCGFNPKNVIEDEKTYLSCMSHAQDWMKILQSNQPADLMVHETYYATSCAP